MVVEWKNQGDMHFDLSTLKNLQELKLENSTEFEHVTFILGSKLKKVTVKNNQKAGDIGFKNLQAVEMIIKDNKNLRDIWITDGHNHIQSFSFINNSSFQDFKYNSSKPLSQIMIGENDSFRDIIITGYPKIDTCTVKKNNKFTKIIIYSRDIKNLNAIENSEYNSFQIKP